MSLQKFVFIVSLLFYANPAWAQLFIDDPSLLQQLESQGFDFARVAMQNPDPISDNKNLYSKNKNYRQLVDSISQDIRETKKKDSRLSTSMRSVHRLFNDVWLRSPEGRFELVGIVNRLDRQPFRENTCGEIRFIYRLAYKTKKPPQVYSRLPMTVNTVYWAPTDQHCETALKQWAAVLKRRSTSATKITPEDLPIQKGRLKSVEVNLQSVRWPSTMRPSMGGYAEYLLRVFQPSAAGLALAPLENTPDTTALTTNPAKRKKLLNWLKQNLTAIDTGVAVIPDEFLAKKVTSVALHGVHRMQNAPFTQLFKETELAGVKLDKYKTFKSPHGLLRRLNDLSCSGCHQGRTVAGFHFLGKDRQDTDAVNAIYVASSDHFLTDQPRRQNFVKALIREKKPDPFRTYSVRGEEESGDFGAHCSLGSDPTFAKWTCKTGFRCVAAVKDSVVSKTGICEPIKKFAGISCQPGKMLHNTNPHKDNVRFSDESGCGSKDICEDTSVGFPAGMCATTCENLKPEETCGSIAILHGFNTCLVQGKSTFSECLTNNVRPAGLKACSEQEACRDDYVCARTLAGKGACIPPYFLFQLRVDGHPTPKA